MPSCFFASGSVRAIRMPQSLYRPPLHHTFWPLTMKRSPSRSALVDSPPRSLPAPGSLNSWHHSRSARQRGVEVLLLLLGRAEAQDRAAGEHHADHVEEGRDAGERALEHPRGVVLGGEAAAAVLGRPVDAGVPGVVDLPLPRDAVLDEIGRADRAVVARRVGPVGGEPLARAGLELVDRELASPDYLKNGRNSAVSSPRFAGTA